MATTKIACAQMDLALGDTAGNRQKIIDGIARAANEFAELVIFPECAVTGYCYQSLEEAAPAAESADGPTASDVTEACRRLGIHAIYGYIEKDGANYYNSARLISPGGPVGNYRKVHLPFLGVDRFLKPGDKPWEVYDLPFGRVGINICYDASFPESARALKLLGAELIILPANWPKGAWRTAEYVVNSRANENHVNFAAVDRVGEERGWRFIGRSKVIDFNGDTVVEGGPEAEELLIAELDVKAASNNKILNVPGEYEMDRIGDRRPEFYTLLTAAPEKNTPEKSRPAVKP
ncbi:MAG TPA: carbon-nitrogen hydrolase family protein [Blastocatellia bacterium]|nr:carbon-nitrogen hydrolase family protein [Blastocatellia bacterium]